MSKFTEPQDKRTTTKRQREIYRVIEKAGRSKSLPLEQQWMTVIGAHVAEIADLKMRLNSVTVELSEIHKRTLQMMNNPIIRQELFNIGDPKERNNVVSKVFFKDGMTGDFNVPENKKQFLFERGYHKIPRYIDGQLWE